MHLCYVDDSGESRHGTTLTALLVEDSKWSTLLSAWLDGRREIHNLFGVPKTRELHATELYKGRGSFCDTPDQEKAFRSSQRAAAGRIVLSSIAKGADFTLVTIGTAARATPTTYARFVAWLEDWAAAQDTRLLIFYDGQQGLDRPGASPGPERRRELWEAAVRSATPYRDVHRSLDLSTRRVLEDVIMQDSRYSQLIQAVDLMAYGAYHKHLQDHPQIWGTRNQPLPAAIRAYMQLAAHWPADSDAGFYWLEDVADGDPETQEPPA